MNSLSPLKIDIYEWLINRWKLSEPRTENHLPILPILQTNEHVEEQDNLIVFQWNEENGTMPIRYVGENFRQFEANLLMGHDILEYMPPNEQVVRRATATYLHTQRCAMCARGKHRVSKTELADQFQLYLPVISRSGKKQILTWYDLCGAEEYSPDSVRHQFDAFQSTRFIDLGLGLNTEIKTVYDLV